MVLQLLLCILVAQLAGRDKPLHVLFVLVRPFTQHVILLHNSPQLENHRGFDCSREAKISYDDNDAYTCLSVESHQAQLIMPRAGEEEREESGLLSPAKEGLIRLEEPQNFPRAQPRSPTRV